MIPANATPETCPDCKGTQTKLIAIWEKGRRCGRCNGQGVIFPNLTKIPSA